MNLNKVFIMGRLTADPEVRSTGTGQRVATFSVATNRVWNDPSGQRKESTEFHNIVLWGKQADVAGQFLVKGATALIEGHLQSRSYQDKQGVTRKVVEIVGEQFQLGPRPAGSSYPSGQTSSHNERSSSPSSSSPSPENNSMTNDDVPIIELGDDGEIKPEDLPF
jgi:single-strand DNA-binding protein